MTAATDPETAALRAALLDLLLTSHREACETHLGRTGLSLAYQFMARRSHPAVADVLMEAAERVRG